MSMEITREMLEIFRSAGSIEELLGMARGFGLEFSADGAGCIALPVAMLKAWLNDELLEEISGGDYTSSERTEHHILA